MSAPDTTGPALLRFAAQETERMRESAIGGELSPWTRSRAKRAFDIAVVVAFLPVLAPLFLIIAFVVRLSSPGPAIFRQTRMGRYGIPFTILKFRTMHYAPTDHGEVVAPAAATRITPVGRLLRRFKLDELPQFLNVLRGDMSLIGPRPKILRHQIGLLNCHPGLTGAATLVFAREESWLANLPPERLELYYREQVLPLKHEIDVAYMKRATALTDLKLLLRTALGWWDHGELLALYIGSDEFPEAAGFAKSGSSDAAAAD